MSAATPQAASLALQEYPILNAALSPCEGFIEYKGDHNISIAMVRQTQMEKNRRNATRIVFVARSRYATRTHLRATLCCPSFATECPPSPRVCVPQDSPSGLIVPNIKQVQRLSLMEISQEMDRLGAEANAGKLGSADLANGTFSLSNIGAIGGTVRCGPMLVRASPAL
eukprot:SAG31_NODE_3230_length_4516_cov_3.158252_7_plen_169_part_00